MPTTKYSEKKQFALSQEQKNDTARFVDSILFALSEMDWSVEEFGRLHGKAIKNKPYTKERIYQMIREDSFPQDPKRRYVIAKLLQLPPALLSVPTLEHLLADLAGPPRETKAPSPAKKKGKLDLEECQIALHTIKQHYMAGKGHEALLALKGRLQALHQEVLYRNDHDSRQIKQLVCDYQMTTGNLLRDQFRVQAAEHHLNKAVFVAQHNEFHELHIAALLQRGVLFFDKGKIAFVHDGMAAKEYFSLALHDFSEGRKLLSQFEDTRLAGDLLLLTGASHAHLAESKKKLSDSLQEVDDAEKTIKEGSHQDKGIYYIDRTSAFLASPRKELRDSQNAYASLEEATKYIGPDLPRRYAYLHITEAQVHLEKGWYPTATEIAKEAITLTKPLQSGVNIARLVTIYERLKESNYGKSKEVAELAIDLMRLQYPHLFP